MGVIKMFSKLPVARKMGIVIAIMSLPFLPFIYTLISKQNEIIDSTLKEQAGTTYLETVYQLPVKIALHRGLTVRYQNGDNSVNDQLRATQSEIENILGFIYLMDARHGTVLASTERMNAIKEHWNAFKNQALEDRYSFARHTALIREIHQLMTHIVDTSGLILDPEFDTYYLNNITFKSLPMLLDQLGQLYTKSSEIAFRGSIESQELAVLLNALEQVRIDLKEIERGYKVAAAYNPALQPLSPKFEEFNKAANTFIKYVEDRFIKSETITVAATEVFAMGTHTIETGTSFDDAAVSMLQEIFTARVTRFHTEQYITLGGIGVFILFALAVSYWVTQFIRNALQLAGEATDALASGRLNVNLKARTHDEVGWLMHNLKTMQEKLVEVVGNIRNASHSIRIASNELAHGNTDLSQRTQEQASSLEEVASSMEEMTSTVNQNAENAGLANELALKARAQADAGGAVVGRAVVAMNEISGASRRIADIIGVIDEIAFQTNLLALNAAVEAARAGEQGRGFAVVASEVRNLAGRCKTAAKEIKGLIQDSVGKVVDGTKLVDESGAALAEIVLAVKKVSDIVAEIATASQEQSQGIAEVNKALLQMDEMTQQNASLVEQAAAASEAMGAQAEELNALVSYFKLDKGEEAVRVEETAVLGRLQKAEDADVTQEQPIQISQRSTKTLPTTRQEDNSDDSDWKEF